MNDRKTVWMKRITVMVLSALLTIAVLPMGTAWADASPGSIQTTLEELSALVARLEADLAAMEAPMAERLEERLEGLLELIEDILTELDLPRDGGDRDALRLRILRLDVAMHRLLFLLDEWVEEAAETPGRPDARHAIEGLHRWMNGVVEAMTAGMDSAQAERFEAAAHQAMRDLVRRLATMAERVRPSDGNRPLLARVVERLELLLFRLDGFILDHVPAPAGPRHRP